MNDERVRCTCGGDLEHFTLDGVAHEHCMGRCGRSRPVPVRRNVPCEATKMERAMAQAAAREPVIPRFRGRRNAQAPCERCGEPLTRHHTGAACPR